MDVGQNRYLECIEATDTLSRLLLYFHKLNPARCNQAHPVNDLPYRLSGPCFSFLTVDRTAQLYQPMLLELREPSLLPPDKEFLWKCVVCSLNHANRI